MRIESTVYRDMGHSTLALANAKTLQKVLLSETFDSRIKSRIMRSIARTWALFDTEKSVDAALVVLDFANDCESVQDIGNSYLAVGEAYRHTAQYDDANNAYDSAISFASDIGNTDSLIWSSLGLVDSLALNDDLALASKTLDALEPFFKTDIHQSLEKLNWELSLESLKLIAGTLDEQKIDEIIE